MDEIELSFIGNIPKNGVLLLKGYMVPSHVGNLEGHTVFLQILWESLNGARDNSEAFRIILFAIFKDNLRSETNAQYGLSFVYPFRYPLIEVCLPQIGHRFTCRTNAREYNMTCLLKYFRLITDLARFPQITKSPCDAGQIPCPVINNTYHNTLLIISLLINETSLSLT